jgi:flavodoxin II
MKIAIFYGSTTCYTEIVAEKLQVLLQTDPAFSAFGTINLHNIKHDPLALMAE